MIDNEEIIVKKHELKLAIQKAIIENHIKIANTTDLGYRSWIVASEVVDNMVKEHKAKKSLNAKINLVLKKLLINN